jgi:hypothetical protein
MSMSMSLFISLQKHHTISIEMFFISILETTRQKFMKIKYNVVINCVKEREKERMM